MAEIATVAAIASLAATGIGVASNIFAGQQRAEAERATAAREEARGRAEFAASQRQAEERKMEARLILSRQQAAAAASGGGAGADAPTIVRIMSETSRRGEFGRESVIYAGQTARDAYYESAGARRRAADNSFLGGILSGIGTGVAGIGRFAEIRAETG